MGALQKAFTNPVFSETNSMSIRKTLVAAPLALAIFAALSGCGRQAQPAPEAQPAQPPIPQVGGQPVVKLTRPATSNGQQMEFLSVTVLPGRGMNVFQITANVPGKGEIPIFASPTLEEAAAKLNGGPDDQNGNESFLNNGAPFLVPYPNRIIGPVSPDGTTITTKWHGKTITLPANWHNSNDPTKDKHAMHGLILASQTQDVQTQPIPDGQTLTGVIHAGDFGGHWLSQTDLSFAITLTGPAVDATITAKNVGKDDEPMAIGWHPYFAVPSGDRKQALLHVPGQQVAAINNYGDVFPTGDLQPVKGTKYDFSAPQGKALDDIYLDDNWSKLQRTNGAVDVTFADPASNYGVHILGLSPELRTIQVYAPPTKQFAAIEEQFNFADPFGKEWGSMNTGMVTLHPGQSVVWHVRLALFQPNK
jgi:galactose mutarotase-like enzyme